MDHLKKNNAFEQTIEARANSQHENQQKHMWCEKNQAAVHEEMKKMNQLPANSTYATHRLRVLKKIQQLLVIERNAAQEEELELLFAGLSL